jgi:ribokinase
VSVTPERQVAAPPTVIVVGSLHYDIVVDAPDRPRKGETLAARSWTPKFGRKGGNQAVAAGRQGVPTAMVGAVGDDSFGAALLAGLDRAQVDRTNVAVLGGIASGMSVAIFDDDGDYGAVIVSGANLAIAPEQAGAELLSRGKVLVLQNEIPEVVNEAVARHAWDLGMATILNAAPARPFTTSLADLVDVLVVNAIEAEMLGGGNVSSLETAACVVERLAARFRSVVVTAGGDGVCSFDQSGRALKLPGIKVVVESTHGAGDAFVGTLAARIAVGEPFDVALSIANREAAKLVSTPEAKRKALSRFAYLPVRLQHTSPVKVVLSGFSDARMMWEVADNDERSASGRSDPSSCRNGTSAIGAFVPCQGSARNACLGSRAQRPLRAESAAYRGPRGTTTVRAKAAIPFRS